MSKFAIIKSLLLFFINYLTEKDDLLNKAFIKTKQANKAVFHHFDQKKRGVLMHILKLEKMLSPPPK